MQIATTTGGSGLDVKIINSCPGSLNSANFAERRGQGWEIRFAKTKIPSRAGDFSPIGQDFTDCPSCSSSVSQI